jgi:glycosyltransferase involved in cell wall biosynthesis
MRVCNIFPQFRSLAGGERLGIKITNLLSARGYKVILLTLSMNPECEKELTKGVEVIKFAPFLDRVRNHYWKVFLEHLFVYRLAKLIPEDSDVCLFHKSSSLPALFYFKRFRKAKVPSFYFCYEPPRFLYDLKEETLIRLGIWGRFIQPFYPLLRYLDKKFAQDSDLILAFSEFMRREIERIYLRPVKMIGPLGVDLKGAKEESKGGEKILLTVNRLQPRKRIDILISALPSIIEEYPKIKVLIVGSGPEEMNLKRLVQELGLTEKVNFLGYVADEDLPNFYSLADIYIHLAKNEPFGLSVLEALAFGIPVISVKEGGPGELIKEGETGLFCEPNEKDLAKKTIYLLREEGERLKMGKKASSLVREKFRWEDFIDRLSSLFPDKE